MIYEELEKFSFRFFELVSVTYQNDMLDRLSAFELGLQVAFERLDPTMLPHHQDLRIL
jgi:hypothetical protein